MARFLKEDKGYVAEGLEIEEDFHVKPLYALMPVLPILILLVGSTGLVPALKMGVPHAMIIGAIVTIAVTRANPSDLGKAFFEGIHTHIIFNSTSLDCTHKFRDFFFVRIALQRLSDIICLEHGLSVIERKKPSERQKRTTYPEKKSFRE